MAVQLTNPIKFDNGNMNEYVVDHENELALVDPERLNLVMGSSVYVIDTDTAYILNGAKEWREL